MDVISASTNKEIQNWRNHLVVSKLYVMRRLKDLKNLTFLTYLINDGVNHPKCFRIINSNSFETIEGTFSTIPFGVKSTPKRNFTQNK